LIEIEKVELLCKCIPNTDATHIEDITDLLHGKQFPEIETLLWEKKEEF